MLKSHRLSSVKGSLALDFSLGFGTGSGRQNDDLDMVQGRRLFEGIQYFQAIIFREVHVQQNHARIRRMDTGAMLSNKPQRFFSILQDLELIISLPVEREAQELDISGVVFYYKNLRSAHRPSFL